MDSDEALARQLQEEFDAEAEGLAPQRAEHRAAPAFDEEIAKFYEVHDASPPAALPADEEPVASPGPCLKAKRAESAERQNASAAQKRASEKLGLKPAPKVRTVTETTTTQTVIRRKHGSQSHRQKHRQSPMRGNGANIDPTAPFGSSKNPTHHFHSSAELREAVAPEPKSWFFGLFGGRKKQQLREGI